MSVGLFEIVMLLLIGGGGNSCEGGVGSSRDSVVGGNVS